MTFEQALLVLFAVALVGLSVFMVHVSKASMKNMAAFADRLMVEAKDREAETWKRAQIESERHRQNEQDAIAKLLASRGKYTASPPSEGQSIRNGAPRQGVNRKEFAIGGV